MVDMKKSPNKKRAGPLGPARFSMLQGGQTRNALALPEKCSGVLTLLVMMKLIQYDGNAVHANHIPSRLDYSTL
ncbi:hypothetical protein [Paenibacillus sp. BAC0078]